METHVCPWWLGYFLINPLRKYMHNPENIIGPFVKHGMKVIDYGCAMGYFSLPMAKKVGSYGKVYCFDIQQRMIDKLMKRAGNANLEQIIEPRLIMEGNKLFDDINQICDFALLFYVAHEVPDQQDLFFKLNKMLKPGAFLLFAEPKNHIKQKDFEQSVFLAANAGFTFNKFLKVSKSHAVLLERK